MKHRMKIFRRVISLTLSLLMAASLFVFTPAAASAADYSGMPGYPANPAAAFANDTNPLDPARLAVLNAPGGRPWMDSSLPIEWRVQLLVDAMTLQEKAGQTVQLTRANIGAYSAAGSATAPYPNITNYYLGSVLSGGGDVPTAAEGGNTPDGWVNSFNRMQDAALATPLQIPVIYQIDAVHGTAHMNSNNTNAHTTIFPHNIGMGATHDPALVTEYAKATAEEMRALDYQGTFAPCVASSQNVRYGRTHEGWGDDFGYNGMMAAAFAKGAQGGLPNDPLALNTDANHPNQYSFLGDGAHVAVCMKHYVSEAISVNGTNQGNAVIPEFPIVTSATDTANINALKNLTPAQLLANPTIQKIILPYQELVAAGARTYMPAYDSINGLKLSEFTSIQNLIKLPKDQGGMGFTGFAVSDYNAHTNGITGANQKIKDANVFNAGIDLAMVVQASEVTGTGWYQYMIQNVQDGTVPLSRINDAVSRILRVKFELGLFENPKPDTTAYQAMLRSDAHIAVARQAVRESLVLEKNDNDIVGKLAGMDGSDIMVAGRFANNIGYQVGSWTISWQGAGDTTYNNYHGTNLLDAIRAEKPFTGTGTGYNATGVRNTGDTHQYKAVIVSIGETPYAEGSGDAGITAATNRGTLQLDEADYACIQNVKANYPDTPIIAVTMFGRPMIVENVIDDLAGFVSAWWPGTEGEGIADVLFNPAYDFTGKDTYPWAWYPEWAGDYSKPVMWPVGHGLKKGQSEAMPARPDRQGAAIAISPTSTTAISGTIYTQNGAIYNSNAKPTIVQPVYQRSGIISSTTFVTGSSVGTMPLSTSYKIYVSRPGDYSIGFTSNRSSAVTNGLKLSVDGTLMATYNAQTNIPAQNVTLTAGQHILRLDMTSACTSFTISSINIAAPGGTAVIVNTDVDTIVTGFNANISVSADVPDGYEARLVKNGVDIGKATFANGVAKVNLDKTSVAAPGPIDVTVTDPSLAVVAAKQINAVAYDPSIWTVAISSQSNAVVASFNTKISLSSPNFDVKANGVSIPAANTSTVSSDGKSFLINGAQIDFMPAGTKIEITGVRLPDLFPSYEFTFRAVIK